MEVVIVIVTFFATVLGAISGIGGGVIIKPVMDALCDYPVVTISFLSGNTVLVMTAVSLLRSRKDIIKIDSVVGFPLALGGALGGVIGKFIFTFVKQNTQHDARIGMIQNIIMVILTATVFVYVLNKHKINTMHMTNKIGSFCAGSALGIFSSFLGIGGGPINIMALSYLFSMDSKHAAINSLYIIFFSQIANLLANIFQGAIPPFSAVLLIAMMTSGVIGAMAGRKVSTTLDNTQIDKLFMGIMLIIVALSVYNVFRYSSLG